MTKPPRPEILDTRVHRAVDDSLNEMAGTGELVELVETRAGIRTLTAAAVTETEEYQRLKSAAIKLAANRVEAALDDVGEEIDDAVLFRLIGLLSKLDLEVEQRLSDMPRTPVENVLMIVQENGLPLERQADLLVKAFREVGGDEYRRALVQLVGDDEATRLIEGREP